jgi:hypothetical protein
LVDTKNKVEFFRSELSKAEGYGEVWKIVKDTVKYSLGEHRVGMILFLDNLPLHIGAYHPVGTNNIVLNRHLVEIVEATTKSKQHVNAFTYGLLAHEYLHALGHMSEAEVRRLVHRISRECFGENHIAAELAEKSPWALLNGAPVDGLAAPKQYMEIVKDFDKPNQRYII